MYNMAKKPKFTLNSLCLGIVCILVFFVAACEMTPPPGGETTKREINNPVWQYRRAGTTDWININTSEGLNVSENIELQVTSDMQNVSLLVYTDNLPGIPPGWRPFFSSSPITITRSGNFTLRSFATNNTRGISEIVSINVVSTVDASTPPTGLKWQYRTASSTWMDFTEMQQQNGLSTSEAVSLRPVVEPSSAAIYFTTGTSAPADPSKTSTLYNSASTPISIDSPGTFYYKARAYNGSHETEVVSVTVTSMVPALTISAPSISPPPNMSYLHGSTVRLLPGIPSRVAALPRNVYYTITTDGTTPSNPADPNNKDRILYTGPIKLTVVSAPQKPTTISAVSAIGTGATTIYSTPVLTRSYTVLGTDADMDGTPDASTDSDGDGVLDSVDVDDDNDGLIEIFDLAGLNNMRFNLQGTSLKTSDSDSGSTMGAPTSNALLCGYSDTDPAKQNPSSGIYLCGYELMNDLDFDTNDNGHTWTDNGDGTYSLDSGDAFYNGGFGWTPIGSSTTPFAAIFSGNGHTIKGLAIHRIAEDSTADNLGLFAKGRLSTSGSNWNGFKVINLTMTGVLLRGRSTIGAVTGSVEEERFPAIMQVRVEGTVHGTGDNVGLVSGQLPAGIVFSSSHGRVIGRNNVGGIVGNKTPSSTGAVRALFSSANVTGESKVGGVFGTFILPNSPRIMYASGDVTGSRNVGGLVGFDETGNPRTWPQSSYSTGTVRSKNGMVDDTFGSIIGSSGDTTGVSDSYGFGMVFGTGTSNTFGSPPSGVTSPIDLNSTNVGEKWKTGEELNIWDYTVRSRDGGPTIRITDRVTLTECSFTSLDRGRGHGINTYTVLSNCGSSLPGQGLYTPPFAFSTSTFGAGTSIPIANRYNFSGSSRITTAANHNPQITWSNIPEGTVELVLIAHSPSERNWVHWLLTDIPPEAVNIPENATRVTTAEVSYSGVTMNQGLTSYSSEATGEGALRGYYGPNQSAATLNHTYVFTLYALNANVTLPEPDPTNFTRFGLDDPAAYYTSLTNALSGKIIEELEFRGTATKP